MASRRRSGLGKGLDALLPEADRPMRRRRLASPRPPNCLLTFSTGTRISRAPTFETRESTNLPSPSVPKALSNPWSFDRVPLAATRSSPAKDAGARRSGLVWEACRRLSRDVDDRQALAMALIENIQREDLNPLEEARALKGLLVEYDLTHEELADAVGKSRTAVSNLLRLLNLAPGVRDLLGKGELEMGHARALLPLPMGDQETVGRRVVARGLSVRQAETLVKQLLHGQPLAKPEPDPDTRRLERNLSERLGAPTTIASDQRGRGRIVIRYASPDELEGVLARLGADRL